MGSSGGSLSPYHASLEAANLTCMSKSRFSDNAHELLVVIIPESCIMPFFASV